MFPWHGTDQTETGSFLSIVSFPNPRSQDNLKYMSSAINGNKEFLFLVAKKGCNILEEKMTSITIRSYKQEDHKDVNAIFAKGIADIRFIKNAIIIGYHSPCVISYLAFFFFIGCL